MTGISEDALRNREDWTRANAEYTDARAGETWAAEEITWGVFGVPEASLGTLGDVAGLDVVELGCGTAYVSAWLARRGARPVGVDVTPAQLATARRCQSQFGLHFPLVEASAEDVPLPSASFDLAVSEYGASIWCDPHLWLPEAYRLLRPGGRLWFLRNSTLAILCAPDQGPPAEALQRPQRGLGRLEWPERPASNGSFRTASSSVCCAAAASTSSTSSSSTRPTTPSTTPTTTPSPSSGRGSGRARRSGSPRSPGDQAADPCLDVPAAA